MWVKAQDGSLVNLAAAQVVFVSPGESAEVLVEFPADEMPVYSGSREACQQVLAFIGRDLEAGDVPLSKVDDALELAK